MPLFNRLTLKNFFKNGANPTESHFSDLIDSTVNKLDDGFAKSINDGLQLSPLGDSKKLMSFYEDIRDEEADWQFIIHPTDDAKGMSIAERGQDHRLFFRKDGRIGVDTLFPKTNLDVNGTFCSHTRVGGYIHGEVPADGKWHPIIEKLTDCQVFEVVAKAGAGKGRGKYAVAHALATSAFKGASSKIRITQSWYGSFWNRIKFRWKGDASNYSLEMKTSSHYGMHDDKPFTIKFHATSLWDDKLYE